MKKILDVFPTYCDAYLEYLNHFSTLDNYCEKHELSHTEVTTMFHWHSLCHTHIELDYFMNLRGMISKLRNAYGDPPVCVINTAGWIETPQEWFKHWLERYGWYCKSSANGFYKMWYR